LSEKGNGISGGYQAVSAAQGIQLAISASTPGGVALRAQKEG